VLGALAAGEAERLRGEARRNRSLVASQLLEEARNRGVPQARRAELLFLSGRSLWGGRRYAASRPPLRDALALSPERAAEIHYLLADGLLRDSAPKLPEAFKENQDLLADPSLSEEARSRGLLQRSEIVLAMGKPAECIQTAAKIPAASRHYEDARMMQGWARLEEARALKRDRKPGDLAKYQEAIQWLRQSQEKTNPSVAPKAMYLIGLGLMETGDARGAADQFSRTRTSFYGTPEALASQYEEADLLRQAGQTEEALAAYGRTFRSIADPEAYYNPWLPLETLRRRTLASIQLFFDKRDYAACYALTKAAEPIFPRQRFEQLLGEASRAWGQELLSKAEQSESHRANALAKEGRQKLRQAGQAFESVAKINWTTRSYGDHLWESANAYLQGHDYSNAVRMFQEYLKNEPQRRLPAVLVGLGECRLALNQLDDAMADLGRCIQQFPRDVASYRARILACQTAMDKGDLAKAKAFVEQNLSGEGLAPTSREWRQSFFLLGEVLYRMKDYPQAIAKMDEAVKRYGDMHESLRARYLMADSYWKVATREIERLGQDVVESSRLDRARRILTARNAALESFRRTQEAILRYQETRELTPSDRSLLRNCQFAAANLLLDLGRCEEAIQAYGQIAGRHQGTPIALEAYLQIARAYQKLQKPQAARDTLEQCRWAMERIPLKTACEESTNHNRRQWAELLDRLTKM
jgi:tetratricopeptide (TPR) repeat protein